MKAGDMSSMTLEDFRTLVFTIAKTHGQPYIKLTDTADLNALINESLRRLCVDTKCLYDDNVTFTLSTSVSGRFDMRDTTYFSREMVDIRRVVIDGSPLWGPTASQHLFSVEQIERDVPNYRTAATGKPSRAAVIPPSTLILSPAPSSVYSNCFVSGWYLPDLLELDTDELALNEEDQRDAAYQVAYDLILPTAEGTSLEKAEYLRKKAELAKTNIASRATYRLGGPSQRKAYRQTIYGL